MRDALKRVPPAYWLARRARMAVGDLLPARTIAGVTGPVHRNDVMYAGSTGADEYEATGRDAARFVADQLAVAGLRARQGLDLGCGHGRVLRHLRTTVPATWTACDIDRSGVRFCQRAFGATPVRARQPLSATPFPSAAYDVTWMGSLVTHLDQPAAADLWRTLDRVSADDALVVLSILGPPMVANLGRFGPTMERHREAVATAVAATGFAYAPYPHYRGGSYGVAFYDVDRLPASVAGATTRAVELLAHAPGAWGGMQDYVALRLSRR